MYLLESDIKVLKWQYDQRVNLPYEAKIRLTKQRILEWSEAHEGKVYIAYSGGHFCGFGAAAEKESNRYQRMLVDYPKRYEFCMKSVEEGGLGFAKALEEVRIPYQTWESVGQMTMDFSGGQAQCSQCSNDADGDQGRIAA